MVSKGNHFQIALFQVNEILYFTQIYTIEAPSSPLVSLRWMGQRNPMFFHQQDGWKPNKIMGYMNIKPPFSTGDSDIAGPSTGYRFPFQNDQSCGCCWDSPYWKCLRKASQWQLALVIFGPSADRQTIWSFFWLCELEHNWLVVWNMNGLFFHILGRSSSQLTFTFFGGVGQPPTR